MNPKEEHHIYDMIVIGGGPAGYTAALYATRAGLDTVVLEKLSAGGQMTLTEQIDNYPGFENGIGGIALGDKMRMGAERFGAKTISAEAVSVSLSEPIKKIETMTDILYGRTVVFATGADPRKLGVRGEEEYIGKGVSYCASCDGMFFRGKTVVVIGGGNSAVEDALILCRICKEVYLVHRRETLRADKIYRDALMQAQNISFRPCCTALEILADQKVRGIDLHDLKTNEKRHIPCEGVFISIGRVPATELVKGQLALDPFGYIIADESTRTTIAGVFAAGDVRTKAVRQIVTAVSDGAAAVHYAEDYLAETRI